MAETVSVACPYCKATHRTSARPGHGTVACSKCTGLFAVSVRRDAETGLAVKIQTLQQIIDSSHDDLSKSSGPGLDAIPILSQSRSEEWELEMPESVRISLPQRERTHPKYVPSLNRKSETTEDKQGMRERLSAIAAVAATICIVLGLGYGFIKSLNKPKQSYIELMGEKRQRELEEQRRQRILDEAILIEAIKRDATLHPERFRRPNPLD